MIARARLMFCILLGCIAGNAAFAKEWRVKDDIEASVSNVARTSSLVIECIQDGSIYLRVQFRAYTNIWANQNAVMRIGDRSFPVRVDIGNDYMFLSDQPKIGISAEVIEALKGGGKLVLEGRAVQHLPAAQRTFPLDGGAKPIEHVQRDCGK